MSELAKRASLRTGLSYLLNTVAVAALIILLGFGVTQSSTQKLVWTCCVFVLMATSLNITMGFMGQLALGHCGFMAVGAYTSTFLANLLKDEGVFKTAADGGYAIALVVGLLAGGIAAALVGLVVGIPALRLQGDYLAIITLGFGLIIKTVLDNIAAPVLYQADCGMYISDKIKGRFLWIVLLITAVCVALMFTFVRSRFGRILRSIRNDGIAAAAAGVNISYYKVMGFTVSAFFAGIAGVLYAAMMSSLATASFAFTNSNIYNSIFIVVMVVMGGMGSLTGSVVTAACMVVVNSLLSSIPESSPLYFVGKYPMLLYALLLIIVVLFFPRGIFGTSEFSLIGFPRAVSSFVKRLFGKKKGGEA